MNPIRDAIVATLSPAERARTVIAAGTHLAWTLDDTTLALPYLDHEGCPILVVDEATADRLSDVGTVDAQMAATPGLGVVLLSGLLAPISAEQLSAEAQQILATQCTCGGQECGPSNVTLLRASIHRVRITGPDDQVFTTIDLDAYRRAKPDSIIAEGVVVAQHLNTDHTGEVCALAARVTRRHPGQILAATISWIDAYGLDLIVIDADGSSAVRSTFSRPLRAINELGPQLRELSLPGSGPA